VVRKRIAITGGEVVTATDRYRADVLVDGERIAALGDASSWPDIEREIDASGKLVLPGGIDTHTHLESPSDGFTTRTADDFRTGTIAAAHGGTTTIVDFVKAEPGSGIYDSYQRRVERAAASCVVDFAFHPVVPVSAGTDDSIRQLRRLASEGARSWKFFMAYPGTMMVGDDVLITGFRAAAEEGVLPMVHAENGHMVADATRRLVEAGRVAEDDHHDAHPHGAEGEAVHRAVAIAEEIGSPLFVVHVSSRLAAEEIAAARSRGLPVFGETCPQYLVRALEDYAGTGFPAAGYVCSPPIRERANQEHLWQALRTGVLSTIGTDHASFTLHDAADLPPQKPRGRGNFPKIPNGVPGIEDRLMVMYESGVVGGRFGPNRFVELTSTAPAKLFGLYPRKGTIAPGSDADIVVWDPAAEHVISARTHHMRADYNLYEGMRVTGRPAVVLARGEVLAGPGAVSMEPGRGSLIVRQPVTF
jgi:dihydropyrimidinase